MNSNTRVTRLAMVGYLSTKGIGDISELFENQLEIDQVYDSDEDTFDIGFKLSNRKNLFVISVPLYVTDELAFEVQIVNYHCEDKNNTLSSFDEQLYIIDSNNEITEDVIDKCFKSMLIDINERISKLDRLQDWIALKHFTNNHGEWCISPKKFFEDNGYIPDGHANLYTPGFDEVSDHILFAKDGSDGVSLLLALGFEILENPVWYFKNIEE